MGVSCTINLVDADPTGEQTDLFEKMIRALQDDPSEFLVFEFMNANNKPGTQAGLVFCQLCREGAGLHTEVRIDRPGGMNMYAALLDDDGAAALVRGMIRSRNAPDLADWKDITEQVLRGTDDSEFE